MPIVPHWIAVTIATSMATAPLVAQAQGYKAIYQFKGSSDGGSSWSDLINVGGTFYGTTRAGGNLACGHGQGCGTVFSITPSGQEKVLYSFNDVPDGAAPSAGLVYADGVFYGTTNTGGAAICQQQGNIGCGTVFSVTKTGAEKVIYSFQGMSHDGYWPVSSLLHVGGKLYGTTSAGGASINCIGGCGTVFSVTQTGHERVLHSFTGNDGDYPTAGLTALHGVFYGTAGGGGTGQSGTLFGITPSGAETTLHAFKGSPGDGAGPAHGRLTAVGDMLYGTTTDGGSQQQGTVFKFDPRSGTETVVYNFFGDTNGQIDGSYPEAGLILAQGLLFGTTNGGGATNRQCPSGCGTIFEVTTSGDKLLLHSFLSEKTGFPQADLLYDKARNMLYGTTAGTGDSSGVVFKIAP
jgi:uncharacterized repeat protein (TIGR03803 family)